MIFKQLTKNKSFQFVQCSSMSVEPAGDFCKGVTQVVKIAILIVEHYALNAPCVFELVSHLDFDDIVIGAKSFLPWMRS